MVDEEAFRAELDKIYTDDVYWRLLLHKQHELKHTNLGTFWKPKYAPEAYDDDEYALYVKHMLGKMEELKAQHEDGLHQYDKNCPTCIGAENLIHENESDKSCAWHNFEECNCGKSGERAIEKDKEDVEEVKNTCKRCGKVWYLEEGELEFLRERFNKVAGLQGTQGKITLGLGLLNPALGAQNATTNAIMTGPLLKLKEELEEKSKCPECQSKNIERIVADENAPTEKTDNGEKRSPSKIEELEKLAGLKKDGLIDDEEFKQMKKEILGK